MSPEWTNHDSAAQADACRVTAVSLLDPRDCPLTLTLPMTFPASPGSCRSR